MKIEINRINQHEFKNFIEKMRCINSFIYAKIFNGQLYSTVYLPAKDAVKYHSVPVDSIFQTDNWQTDQEIKLAFFDGAKLIEGIKKFGADPIMGDLEISVTEEEVVATSLTVYNDELRINFNCTQPSLGFRDIPADKFDSIFSRDSYDFSFYLDTGNLTKIRDLHTFDNEETFKLKSTQDSIDIEGNNFNAVIQHTGGVECETILYKKYLQLLDKENYYVYVINSESRVIFVSEDSDTYLTVSSCKNPEE